jgi:general secretion pathway protein F
MAAFEYRAVDAEGKSHQGVLQGDSARQVRAMLRQRGFIPLQVEAVTQKTTQAGVNKGRLKSEELALITRQLATVIGSGLTVEEALFSVSAQAESRRIENILAGVRAKILEGHSFAHALGTFPDAFSNLYRATVGAAEEVGDMGTVLARLADFIESQDKLQAKLQQAMIYPIVMLIVSFGILGFLFTFVVPKITGLFADLKQQLPFATRLLIGITAGVKAYGIFILIAIIVALFLFTRALKNRKFKIRWHLFLLRVPLIGKLFRINNVSRFARTLGVLAHAGVPMLQALRAATKVVTCVPMSDAIEAATVRVNEGMGLQQALRQTQFFPAMVLQLIASGEKSGNLADMLSRAADLQEYEVSRTLDTVLSLFEPLMILVMGLVVLFIVTAILLPIFSASSLIG